MNKEAIEYFAEGMIDEHSFSYRTVSEAERVIKNGPYFCAFDAMTLCIYEHNLDRKSYHELVHELNRRFQELHLGKEHDKERKERVSLLHFLLTVGEDYIDYQIIKSTRPDFILLKEQKIGIEVVRLTTPQTEQMFNISSKFFGQNLSAKEMKTAAMKRYKAAGNYQYIDIAGSASIQSGLFDVNERIRVFIELILEKYRKYCKQFNDFDQFVVLADAEQSKSIEVTSQYDADRIIYGLKEKLPGVHGFNVAILWEENSRIVGQQYEI